AHVAVVRRDDVIDELLRRPPRRVVLGSRRRQRRERGQHGIRIRVRGAAGLLQRSPAAAAEVDPEPLEDRGGSEIAGDDVADRGIQRDVHLRASHGGDLRVAAASLRRYDPRHMSAEMEEVLRRSTIFRRLTPEDRRRLAAVSSVKTFEKGAFVFNEGDPSDMMYTVVTGRVKVFKVTPRGT